MANSFEGITGELRFSADSSACLPCAGDGWSVDTFLVLCEFGVRDVVHVICVHDID